MSGYGLASTGTVYSLVIERSEQVTEPLGFIKYVNYLTGLATVIFSRWGLLDGIKCFFVDSSFLLQFSCLKLEKAVYKFKR